MRVVRNVSFVQQERNGKMKDSEFLQWISERLVYVYKESPNVDFVHEHEQAMMDRRYMFEI